MPGKALSASCYLDREALRFTFQKKAGGTEARKEGTSFSFTSCMVGMSASPYGVFVDEA